MKRINWSWHALAAATIARTVRNSKNRPTFRIALLASALVAILASAAAASAAGPEITRFSFEDAYVDTYTCPGMELDTQLEGHVIVQEFSETRAQVFQQFTYTVTANGKTFVDNESFMEFANNAGVSTFRGTNINIQVPGYGNILADRGTITIDFTTDPWTVLFEGGPHPFFHGDYGPLCAYLSS